MPELIWAARETEGGWGDGDGSLKSSREWRDLVSQQKEFRGVSDGRMEGRVGGGFGGSGKLRRRYMDERGAPSGYP